LYRLQIHFILNDRGNVFALRTSPKFEYYFAMEERCLFLQPRGVLCMTSLGEKYEKKT